jgi:hypothetical protein
MTLRVTNCVNLHSVVSCDLSSRITSRAVTTRRQLSAWHAAQQIRVTQGKYYNPLSSQPGDKAPVVVSCAPAATTAPGTSHPHTHTDADKKPMLLPKVELRNGQLTVRLLRGPRPCAHRSRLLPVHWSQFRDLTFKIILIKRGKPWAHSLNSYGH